MESPLVYFTDPVLRGPTIGSMLMCLAASLVGVLAYLRRQSLLGESLSHAAYPGVILGLLTAAVILPSSWIDGGATALLILVGAAIGAAAGLVAIQFMERRLKVHPDTALCFVLASFFGIGLTVASRIQISHTQLYRKIQVYLYGQAATMSDVHIYVYGGLSLCVVLALALLYKELQTLSFDRIYAASLGIPTKRVEALLFSLIVFSIILGIRSVGVVLMSAMLIAPAVAARQFTHRLSTMLLIAGGIGLFSGFFGTYFSVELSRVMQQPGGRALGIPSGPVIVITSATICLLSLLFAPERGLVNRYVRVQRFRHRCLLENILKALWRRDPEGLYTLDEIHQLHQVRARTLNRAVRALIKHGWIERGSNGLYQLSQSGQRRAAYIVRLHRLWELYLADVLGMGVRRVHASAEEMEHVITPELERQLTEFLEDPVIDPHLQPIPPSNLSPGRREL